MASSIVPSIFESFNARALRPEQVAQTFVISDAYHRLAQRRNTVIVGPRGSGKTTLLKMLQQPALEAWREPRAEYYCDRIDFTGVLIAMDVPSAEQIRCLGGGTLDPVPHQLLAISVFTTLTLRALVSSMLSRTGFPKVKVERQARRVSLSSVFEAQLARSLQSAWSLPEAIPSLLSLKHGLTSRLSELRQLASQEALLGPEGREGRLAALPFLHLHFTQAALVAVEQFNDLVGEPAGKWALMFDELELAPTWIRVELLAALRTSPEEFLFKLAMSPSAPDAHTFEGVLAASPDQDFDQIALWYAEKNDGYGFCEKLWYSMLKDRGIQRVEPRQVLGRSEFETLADEWTDSGTAYASGSRSAKRFARMYRSDPSFRDYLNRKDIDVNKLDVITPDKRAADVRKITPLLVVREFYRFRGEDSGARRRPRKSAMLFAGADSLFAISEGNPRWFIAVVGRLLDRFQAGKITPASQAREISNASERFAALLKNVPAPLLNSRGLLGVVKKIGAFFHEEVVRGSFNPDPPGTFIVDSASSEALLDCLERALNAGAIVYVPDDVGQLLLSSLRGKRFRLSYLLAPLYGFPLRLGRPRGLASILEGGRSPSSAQLELIGGRKE